MKINWTPTDRYYREVIAASSAEAREAIFRERFLTPWQPMLRAVGPMLGVSDGDDLAAAARLAWAMPDELAAVPPALEQLAAADAWQVGEEALHTALGRFNSARLPFDHVEGWLMIAAPERSNPLDRGYTGAIDYTSPRFVCQYSAPNPTNLRALPGAVAHELHHLIRLRCFPWDMQRTSVADYIVHEGLAESFATALFGEEVLGYYVSEVGADELVAARALVQDGLERSGFNIIRGYLFGDAVAGDFGFERVGMPTFGGYAVGYHVVQAFLRRYRVSIEDATFLSAAQIIRESGYFDERGP